MKKLILPILLFLMFMPFVVNAKTKTYDICQNGCEYDRLADVIIDVNLLQEEYDVVINFKDSGPYYLIKDERDFEYIQSKMEDVCTSNGGTWDGYDCISTETLDIIGGNTYIYNSNLNSVILNGVENKTTIYPTGIFSISEFLSALTFSGVLQSNFEFNNLNFESSLYFASVTKAISGKINNCDVKHSTLVFGNVNLDIYNSTINNVYSLGSELLIDDYSVSQEKFDELKEQYDLKDPIVRIDKKTTSFHKKYFKYTEKDIEATISKLKEFYDNNPMPKYEGQYPEREDYQSNQEYFNAIREYWSGHDAWVKEHQEEINEWEAKQEQLISEIIAEFREKKGAKELDKNDYLDLILSFTGDIHIVLEDYYEFEQQYIQDHPKPEVNTPEYEAWYKEFSEEVGHRMIDGDIFPSSGEIILKIISSIIFPGDDGNFSNMVEFSKGKIYFIDNNHIITPINKKIDLKEISQVFGTSLDGWTLSRNDIVKISGNEIIPLKAGTVVLSKQTADDIYIINIEITPDMLNNPETSTGTIHILILILSTLILFFFLKKKNSLN